MHNIYELFKAEVKKQMFINKFDYAAIAKLTGYKKSTIEAFMCGARESENVAKAIGKLFDIDV